MSFRTRLALLSAAALAVALAAAGVLAYASERHSLSSELDALLRARAAQVTPDVVQQVLAANYLLAKQHKVGADSGRAKAKQVHGPTLSRAPPGAGAVVGLADLELVTSRGERALASPSGAATVVPVDPAARAIASDLKPSLFRTVKTPGDSLRVFVFPAAPGVAAEVAASLAPLDASLHDLRMTFAAIGLGALLVVALLASLVARQALRPVTALRRAAEAVVETGDLRQRVAVAGHGRDELGLLATTVNAMLSALERSVGAQRQLVADASHELRTPLTTLITNLQLLDEPGGLEARDARELVAHARRQAEELAVLVSDLVELARTSEVKLELEDVRVDLLAAAAVERVQGRTEDVSFRTHLSPCTVRGNAELLERAIGNLLDNASKWSPPGGTVELVVDDGDLVVRDEGPGIAAADLPFVFDRFYRSRTARGQPGSGLGLAIVRQIAELHGGITTAESTDRGAVLRLALPPMEAPLTATPAAARRGIGPDAQAGIILSSVKPDHCSEVLGDRPDVA